MGRTTQFNELPAVETRLADRTLVSALLAWRLTGLVTGVASFVAGRERYRTRSAALGQLGLALSESVWYARRVSRGDRWSDPKAARVDVATAAAVLAIGQLSLAPADLATWINWAPWTLAANAVCGQAMGVDSLPQAVAGGAALLAVYALQQQRVADAVANSAAFASFFVVCRLWAAGIRGSAVRLAAARSEAVREGQILAQARERSAQLRLLHDDALQTLETIAAGRFADLPSVQGRARSEADRLDRAVNRPDPRRRTFLDRLSAVVAHHVERGLSVRLQAGESSVTASVSASIGDVLTEAFCGAANEALTNVHKHAGVSEANVRVTVSRGQVTVTIADDGIGFDRPSARGGFGMGESIGRRMREAGGAARIESEPGRGTNVILSGPA